MKNRIVEYFIALIIFCMLIYFVSKLKDQSDNRPAGIIQTTNLSAQLQSDSTRASLPESKIKNVSVNSFPDYTIVATKCDQSKCVTDVKIPRRMTKSELSLLSRTIKAEAHANGRFHIFYYLPEMIVDNGAWARVDFNPELSITILGKSLDEEQNLLEQVKKIDSYIGLWEDDQMDKDVLYRIRIDNKLGMIIELVSASDPAQSSVIAEVIKSMYRGKVKLTDKDNSRGEYYIIEKNSNISVYDKQGYVFTLRMLKYHGF